MVLLTLQEVNESAVTTNIFSHEESGRGEAVLGGIRFKQVIIIFSRNETTKLSICYKCEGIHHTLF